MMLRFTLFLTLATSPALASAVPDHPFRLPVTGCVLVLRPVLTGERVWSACRDRPHRVHQRGGLEERDRDQRQ